MVYSGSCEPCNVQQISKFVSSGGWLIVIFFSLVAAFLWMSVRCTEDSARRFVGAWGWYCIKAVRNQNKLQLGARVKILWTCYQIISQMSWTLPDVVFPPIVESAIRWMSALVVFSFDVNIPMNCINPNYNYYHNVIATNVGGPGFVCILSALAIGFRKWRNLADKDGRLRLFGVSIVYISLLLSYMVLPAVSTATFKLFTCKDFRPDGGPFVLLDDMSVECGTARHAVFIVFAVVMMLSPIGGAVRRRLDLAFNKTMAHVSKKEVAVLARVH